MSESNILIYRDQLLPYSETFIPAQVEHYRQYRGWYVGSAQLQNPPPAFRRDRTLTLDQHKPFPAIWKTLFKVFGSPHPQWLHQIKALSPQLVHAHFGLDGILALPLAKKLNIPLVVTFHGYYATTEPDPDFNPQDPLHWRRYLNQRGQFFRHLYFRRRTALFRAVDCVVAVSQHIRQALIRQGCPADKIHVRYIGVDSQQFQVKANVERQSTVLFVGRLVEKKGCEYLLRAMAQVQQNLPETGLLIIGDGPLRQSLENLASKTLRRYQFLGKQPAEIVRQRMAQSRVLVAPSATTDRGETEGLPIVILEAMAMGLPVVASRHAGIPEAILHNESGSLVAERDIAGLGQAIADLLRNLSLWQQRSIAGRQRVEAAFDLCANTRSLEALYTQVLNQRLAK